MNKIKIGIVGYGNLGRGVEKAVKKQKDMELIGIYSRRHLDHPLVQPVERLEQKQDLDVLILCTGSAADLPMQTPRYAGKYHVVDSYDHHQQIPDHYKNVDMAARAGGNLALISCGWDPGIFSMMRALFHTVLLEANVYTFWGKGISQGHSDAIRRIKGVKDARQYTIPMESAVEAAQSGSAGAEHMDPTELHRRECFVVADEGEDLIRIEREIREMPDYFSGYDTTVHFISQEKLENEHSGFPHGGRVIGTGGDAKGVFQLDLSSNPEFTAGVLTAYAKAVYKMAKAGETGCRTVMDVPIKNLCKDMFMHM